MKIKNILFGFIIFIFLINNVNAFGVASPFASDTPVVVLPGESKDLVFSIQNGAGATEDINAKIEILEGKDIVTVEKSEYFIAKNEEVSATVRVTVPANVGPDYNGYVKLSVKATPSTKTSGAVGMSYGITTDFLVLTTSPPRPEIPIGSVVKEKKEISYNDFLTALIVVIIIGIIIYFIEKRNKIKGKKK